MPELEQAEKVMFDHPDSSLHILESMEVPSSRTDKENHALWCLLTSQAKVKQLMKISSDSRQCRPSIWETSITIWVI